MEGQRGAKGISSSSSKIFSTPSNIKRVLAFVEVKEIVNESASRYYFPSLIEITVLDIEEGRFLHDTSRVSAVTNITGLATRRWRQAGRGGGAWCTVQSRVSIGGHSPSPWRRGKALWG